MQGAAVVKCFGKCGLRSQLERSDKTRERAPGKGVHGTQEAVREADISGQSIPKISIRVPVKRF